MIGAIGIGDISRVISHSPDKKLNERIGFMKSIPASLAQSLRVSGQSHLLSFLDSLNPVDYQRLVDQLMSVDWPLIRNLVSTGFAVVQEGEEDFEPPVAVRANGEGVAWSISDAEDAGVTALRAGAVAAVVVAGGQGTRLGFEHPKGMLPIGPVSNRTLFQIIADRLKATGLRYGVKIPLYLMTSDATHQETISYFSSNNYLGLDPSELVIFKQGTMPAVDISTGRCLMAAPNSLALSPDGHGGTLAALQKNGCLDDAESRGVKHLAYIQVDNPLAQLCDPVFLGHHLLSGSEMTTQVVKKRYPLEKVGNVVRVGEKVRIVEYSDLPEHSAKQTNEDGELRFWAGNIAVHLIELPFLRRSLTRADSLPFHRAFKHVPYVDRSGQTINPSEPNAVKFERFIFDLLPHAKNALVVEADPAFAFAPVKNAAGSETDTAELAKDACSNLHKGWLERLGITVVEGVRVEINPLFALDMSELATKVSRDQEFLEDHYFCS